MTVGAISSTPLNAAILPQATPASDTDECKEKSRSSALNKEVRTNALDALPHRKMTPEVRPTIMRTRITWMAMAIALRKLRSGRAVMLPRTFGGGKTAVEVFVIKRNRICTVHSDWNRSKITFLRQGKDACRSPRKNIFLR